MIERIVASTGVLLALEGLHPPASGARVSFRGGKPTAIDGPFAEVKEVLGGHWMIDVRSREEAIEWARRCPASEDDVIEIRRVHEQTSPLLTDRRLYSGDRIYPLMTKRGAPPKWYSMQLAIMRRIVRYC